MSNVTPLYIDSNPHISAMYDAIREAIFERGEGNVSLATTIGILQLLQSELIRDAFDE